MILTSASPMLTHVFISVNYLIPSRVNEAVPLPLNSESILNILFMLNYLVPSRDIGIFRDQNCQTIYEVVFGFDICATWRNWKTFINQQSIYLSSLNISLDIDFLDIF